MSSREDTPEPGTAGTGTSQAAPAAPQAESQESGACPECRHISTACSSSCRHCFCWLCLWDWSLGPAACPRCRRPTRHPYPQHVALYHEVQERVYDSKRQRRGREGWPRGCSRYLARGRPWDRRRRRSMRWPRDGRRQSRHGRGSESPRWRWWEQQRSAWEDPPEEGRTPRLEWAIPDSSQGSQSRRRSSHRSCRSWRRRERSRSRRGWSRSRSRNRSRNRSRKRSRSRSRSRVRSQSWDRRQSRSSRREQDTQTGSQEHSAGQRHWRSWNSGDRHAPRPQHHVPSERSETQPWEDAGSSRHWCTRRRRSRGRSHRRRQNSQGTVSHDHSTNQRRWNAGDRHSPRPQHDSSSRKSERHQWQEHSRSQSRGRSHGTGQNSHTASQGMLPPDHSTGQREQRSWSGDQEQAPRFQQDISGSPGRSQHQHRNHAGRRDS